MLLKPIDLPERSLVNLVLADKSPDARAEGQEMVWQYVEDQIGERISALGSHYGLSKERAAGWERLLLLKLAEDFIVGFRATHENLRIEPGRPVGKIKDDPVRLILAIRRLTEDGHTVLSACDVLTRPKAQWSGISKTSLKSRYDRLVKKLDKSKREGVRAGPLYERLMELE